MSKNNRQEQEKERLEMLENIGRKKYNGIYGDYFGGSGDASSESVLTFGTPAGDHADTSGNGAEGTPNEISGAGRAGEEGTFGKRKGVSPEMEKKIEDRVDALEQKGREVADRISAKAEAILRQHREAGSLKAGDAAGSSEHTDARAAGSAGNKEGISGEAGRADALIGRQDAMSSALQDRTDALKRADDALREVQALFNNPLYNGMPSLTGRGESPEIDPSLMAGSRGDLFTGFAGGESVRGNGSGGAVPGANDPGMSPDGNGIPNASEGTAGAAAAQTAEGQQAVQASAEAEKEPEKDPMEELEGLIGLSTIKHDVKELTDFVKIQKLRKDGGLKSVPVSLHLVFTGNPGTGKTTVARIMAKLYRQIGVLSKGQLVEVDRSGLVAGYVGQTALKTAKKIEEAKGGVLFIDEAYALARKDDTFGQEAIDTILKAMEDSREDFVVIVAGYTKPMEDFINSNPGLKSRFNKYIEFPDYTIDELMGIFDMNCKKYDYEAADDVKAQIRAMLVQRKLAALENFANAREVRNFFEEIITNQARRVAAMENPSREDMKQILLEDLTETAEADALKTMKKAAEAGDAQTDNAESTQGDRE